MEAYQIIYGFSEIKSELQTKSRISKPLEQLELWFTLEEDVLYVHDYTDHTKCIALAIYNPADKAWKYFLKTGSYADKLIKYVCELFVVWGYKVIWNI